MLFKTYPHHRDTESTEASFRFESGKSLLRELGVSVVK
jgi:hypothetical protein